MDIRKINLNLLLHLDTLLTEKSVSKAAEKSFLSQTAMSHILKQLRELFDDPLFIRKPHGLQPTQKALELTPKIKEFLNCSTGIFQDKIFDPSHEEAHFKAALSGVGEYIILPRLCAYLSKYAPNFSLNICSLSEYLNLTNLLATEMDFSIAPGFVATGPNIHSELLFKEEAVCIMSKNHWLSDKELTMDLYMKSRQIDIQLGNVNTETLIKKDKNLQGFIQRNIKVTLPNFFSAIEIVYHSDLIATVPKTLAFALKERYNLVVKPFPFQKKTYKINLYYHKRLINYKPMQWMIKAIIDCKDNIKY